MASTSYFSPTLAGKYPGRGKVADETDEPMMALSWFHPFLTRHAADCMLIDNAPEGSFLLRSSSDYQTNPSYGYVLSVKLSSSVQHIKVAKLGSGYSFGNSTFENVESFRRHFELEKPVIGGDSGITVVLKFPYSRFINESHFYTDVVHHAVTNMLDSFSDSEEEDGEVSSQDSTHSDPAQPQPISSKEGYLTKQGRIRKSWKCRWIILRGNTLSYYKTKQSKQPIDRLDMNRALSVEYDNSKQKDYCFRVEFSHRTYYFYSASAEDSQHWVELLRSKVQAMPSPTFSTN